MSLHPVRFLHAGNLCLGDPVRTAISLDERAREIAAFATIRAWERVVDAALEHRADFLLVTGAPSGAADIGIAAETALESGVDRLEDAGVGIVIAPGSTAGAEAWSKLSVAADFVIDAEHGEAVPLENRRGEPAGVLLNLSVENTWYDLPHDLLHVAARTDETPVASDGWPQVLDYLATGSSCVWKSREGGDAHDVKLSGPQPVRIGARQPSGCLLADVDDQGRLSVRRLQTSTVRLCELGLSLDKSSSLEDAALQMQDQIERLPADPNERLRLIRWRVRGRGPLLAGIAGDGGRSIDAEWRSDFGPWDQLPVLSEFVAEFDEPDTTVVAHDRSAVRREIAAGIGGAVESLGHDWSVALEPLVPDGGLREFVASRVSSSAVRRSAAAFAGRPVTVSGSEEFAS